MQLLVREKVELPMALFCISILITNQIIIP